MRWLDDAKHRVLLLSVFIALFTAGARGQQNSEISGTEISGTVTDQNGAAIANAQITLTSTATGTTLSTQSNSAGVYSFPGLNVGTYDQFALCVFAGHCPIRSQRSRNNCRSSLPS